MIIRHVACGNGVGELRRYLVLYGYVEKKCQNSSAFKDWNTKAYIWYYMEIGSHWRMIISLPANLLLYPQDTLYVRNVLNG